MAGKRGQPPPPAHVTKKQFLHPGIEFPLIQVLEGIDDPRKPSVFFRYSLTSVLSMTAVIMSQGMTEWFAQYVDMTSGVPCEQTYKDGPIILGKAYNRFASARGFIKLYL